MLVTAKEKEKCSDRMKIDKDYLKRKADEAYRDIMSIIDMSNRIDAGNATPLVRANQGTSHLCGLVKAYVILQLYNEISDDPKSRKAEKEIKEALDNMQKILIQRYAEFLALEEKLDAEGQI